MHAHRARPHGAGFQTLAALTQHRPLDLPGTTPGQVPAGPASRSGGSWPRGEAGHGGQTHQGNSCSPRKHPSSRLLRETPRRERRWACHLESEAPSEVQRCQFRAHTGAVLSPGKSRASPVRCPGSGRSGWNPRELADARRGVTGKRLGSFPDQEAGRRWGLKKAGSGSPKPSRALPAPGSTSP